MRVDIDNENLEIGVKRIIFNSSMRKVRKSKGVSQKELARRTRLSIARIAEIERLKRVPTYDEADKIADALDSTISDILPQKVYEKIVPKIKHLPNEVYFDVVPLSFAEKEMEQLGSPKGDIERIEKEINMEMVVKKYVGRLQERERRILTLRFGLDGEYSRTLEETGKEFGVTRERIRGLEYKAMKKIRRWMKEDELDFSNCI